MKKVCNREGEKNSDKNLNYREHRKDSSRKIVVPIDSVCFGRSCRAREDEPRAEASSAAAAAVFAADMSETSGKRRKKQPAALPHSTRTNGNSAETEGGTGDADW